MKHKKSINWDKIGKGLSHGLVTLDRAGKREADWFFGADLKKSYEPEKDFIKSWDREADNFFRRKSKKKDREIIIIRGSI